MTFELIRVLTTIILLAYPGDCDEVLDSDLSYGSQYQVIRTQFATHCQLQYTPIDSPEDLIGFDTYKLNRNFKYWEKKIKFSGVVLKIYIPEPEK